MAMREVLKARPHFHAIIAHAADATLVRFLLPRTIFFFAAIAKTPPLKNSERAVAEDDATAL